MIRVVVITVSDSTVAGTREDRSGPALVARVTELGWAIAETRAVADEGLAIGSAIRAAAEVADVVLTTGGTGIAPRDVTPEATQAVADRKIPGFGELMRREVPSLAWSVKTDDWGRSLALDLGDTGAASFPVDMVLKRFDRQERLSLRELSGNAYDALEELLRRFDQDV